MKKNEVVCIHCGSEDIDIYDYDCELDGDGISVYVSYTCSHCENMGRLTYDGELTENTIA